MVFYNVIWSFTMSYGLYHFTIENDENEFNE